MNKFVLAAVRRAALALIPPPETEAAPKPRRKLGARPNAAKLARQAVKRGATRLTL